MKYYIATISLVMFVIIYVEASVGLAVHRTHSISVASEIISTHNVAETNRTAIEKLVSSTGNGHGYYSTITAVALIGILSNLVAITRWLFSDFNRRAAANRLTAVDPAS